MSQESILKTVEQTAMLFYLVERSLSLLRQLAAALRARRWKEIGNLLGTAGLSAILVEATGVDPAATLISIQHGVVSAALSTVLVTGGSQHTYRLSQILNRMRGTVKTDEH